MYLQSVNGIIFILIYGFNSVNCEDDFGKVLIFVYLDKTFFRLKFVHDLYQVVRRLWVLRMNNNKLYWKVEMNDL